ncbi:hypothetical protein [Pyxidicoccus caerfyrddinensis]|uniref:hypothetical protein n=1 Tax=Pyxidicoccus caerfyrddinensis TaxID=2709663 RepID=UPI0013D98CEC|nr:hypothetical protein [Pyxidicoccus caerfyrddinensis]
MNRHTRTVVASLFALSTFAGSAQARSVSAFSGKPTNPADATCFSEWYGTLTNNCSGTRVLEFPLPIDTSGSYWGYVNAYGATSANNVGCQVFGLDKGVSLVWGGSIIYLPTFGASAGIELGRAYAPDLGTLNIACWVNQGGRVNSVSWGL